MVADGTVTPLMRGAKLEGAGEEHSEAVAAELAAALEEKVQMLKDPCNILCRVWSYLGYKCLFRPT